MQININNTCSNGKQNKRFYITIHNSMGEPLYFQMIKSSGRLAFLVVDNTTTIKILTPPIMKDFSHKSL
jgi:hypothetical protein